MFSAWSDLTKGQDVPLEFPFGKKNRRSKDEARDDDVDADAVGAPTTEMPASFPPPPVPPAPAPPANPAPPTPPAPIRPTEYTPEPVAPMSVPSFLVSEPVAAFEPEVEQIDAPQIEDSAAPGEEMLAKPGEDTYLGPDPADLSRDASVGQDSRVQPGQEVPRVTQGGPMTADQLRQATGAHHEVGVHELFFSTTDGKGIITDVNDVFVRLSRFSRDELMGAPHSIIRHPDMPAGAFKVMWDTLEAGQTFCGYVNNLAADGSTYTVFATVTALGDDYLSVRVRPRVDAVHEAVQNLYKEVRPMELEARASSGASAREAAVLGANELAEKLGAMGFPTYRDVVLAVLPLEVAQRDPVDIEPSGPLAAVMVSGMQIVKDLVTWSQRQQSLQEVADDLAGTQQMLRDVMAEARDAGAKFAEAGGGDPSLAPVMLTVNVWAQMMDELARMIDGFTDMLSDVRDSCARTRFTIALGQLHTETVVQFGKEVSGGYPEAEADASIRTLCQALTEGFANVRNESTLNASLAQQTVTDLRMAHELISMPRDLIATWKVQAANRDSEVVQKLLPQVSEQVEKADELLDRLSTLADRCVALAVPLDTSDVDRALDDIGRELA